MSRLDAGSSSDPVSTDPTATFSEAVVPSTVSFTLTDPNGNAVPGTTSFNGADTVATFTPTSSLAPGTTYTATISGAKDNNGETMLTPYTYTYTTSKSFDSGASAPAPSGPTPRRPVHPTRPTPARSDLGVQFRASSDGTIAGVRFYKESDNTGSHIGSLWSSTGTLLASGTFSGESASGWQELDFSSPVAVTANTTYVVSYHTNAGHYALTSNGLASAVTNGPLTALASGGVYAYGSANAFPSNTFNASNYWVNVVYTQTAEPRHRR